MARNRIFYGLFLLAAVVFHSFYTGWFSFFLLLFSVLLPVFSLLVSLPAMLRAAYTPQLPLRCFCGQDAQFALQPSSASRLPVSCCRLHLLVCDAVGGTQQAEWLTLAGTLHFSLRVDTRHAGQQTFRVDRARVYDALGLVGLPLQLPTACSIAVEPEPLEPAELPNLSQFQYRSYHPKPGGGFSEIHDLREYRPGDSLNSVHWKLSAKTGKLTVREAMEPLRQKACLTLTLGGTPEQVDDRLGRLLWIGRELLYAGMEPVILVSSGEGTARFRVSDEKSLSQAVDAMLCLPEPVEPVPPEPEGTGWHYAIGGSES